MLILTRKTGQGFRIGDDVEITITEISGDKVRVGINAPKEVKILRSELRETVEQNQQAAGTVKPSSMRALAAGLKSSHVLQAAQEKPAGGAAGEQKPDGKPADKG